MENGRRRNWARRTNNRSQPTKQTSPVVVDNRIDGGRRLDLTGKRQEGEDPTLSDG